MDFLGMEVKGGCTGLIGDRIKLLSTFYLPSTYTLNDINVFVCMWF